ncbi:MAG: TrmH family RNA methyltransferase [Planctomycetota bacterium]
MLSSLSNPRVKAVAKLRDASARRATRRFVVEGSNDTAKALLFGWPVIERFTLAETSNTTWVSPDVMAKMSYRKTPPDELVVFSSERAVPRTRESPRPGDLWLVCVGSEKPGNLGAMARTAAAVGCRGLIATGTVDLLNPNAIRNSRAAMLAPWCTTATDDEARMWLLDHEVRTLALVAPPAVGESLWSLPIDDRPTAILVGPEHAGLDDAWLGVASDRVTIPMRTDVSDSLNAGITAAVALFELDRRRRET